MPPRLPFSSFLGSSSLCLRPANPPKSCSLPLISVANAHSKTKKRQKHDPYALAQAKARKEANIRRQAELQKERAAVLGDPVRGITTPFIESFDKPPKDSSPDNPFSDSKSHLNHFLTPAEVEKSLQHSFILTQPLPPKGVGERDPMKEAARIDKHEEEHERAAAAIARIVSLSNGNAKDLKRVNIQRCIETFGRHNTDAILPPRLPSYVPRGPDACPAPVATPRIGPDTGSSEVQVAILTAKIRSLVTRLHSKDKVNKRNLRLLVHKRQKLLAYLRRKEHGGPRWQNLIETLGLTEGTWRGEISL